MTEDLEVRTYKIKGIVQPLGGPWYRHPISWWKMRYFREDLRQIAREEEADPIKQIVREEMDKRMEEAFLFGSGDSGTL